MSERSQKEALARFMDPQAFEPVPAKVDKAKGLAIHVSRKARREIAAKRAAAAIRFFLKPEQFERLNARFHREAPTAATPDRSATSPQTPAEISPVSAFEARGRQPGHSE